MVSCSKQKEHKVIQACKSYFSKKALQDVFVFTWDRMRRYEGAWHLERRLLFPGYVFLESQNGEQLSREIKQSPEILQILGGGRLKAIEPEEERFLQSLCGASHHFGMSRGYIQNGQTFVTEGPLQGKESLIRNIDRHKRIARVGITLKSKTESTEGGGNTGKLCGAENDLRELQMGLEIVSKT